MSPTQILKRKMMDNQSSSHYLTLIDNESNPNLNVSQYDVRGANDGLSENLTASQIKSLKQQKQMIESNFKRRFYHQLSSQLEKRIESVNQQTDILKKQKNLYSIYGTGMMSSQTSLVQNSSDLIGANAKNMNILGSRNSHYDPTKTDQSELRKLTQMLNNDQIIRTLAPKEERKNEQIFQNLQKEQRDSRLHNNLGNRASQLK